jgi:hypothetical protein
MFGGEAVLEVATEHSVFDQDTLPGFDSLVVNID